MKYVIQWRIFGVSEFQTNSFRWPLLGGFLSEESCIGDAAKPRFIWCTSGDAMLTEFAASTFSGTDLLSTSSKWSSSSNMFNSSEVFLVKNRRNYVDDRWRGWDNLDELSDSGAEAVASVVLLAVTVNVWDCPVAQPKILFDKKMILISWIWKWKRACDHGLYFGHSLHRLQ